MILNKALNGIWLDLLSSGALNDVWLDLMLSRVSLEKLLFNVMT